MSFSLCSNLLSPLKLRRISSSILFLKSVVTPANLKRASSSRRFFCSLRSPLENLSSYAENLGHSVAPSFISLTTSFSAAKTHHSPRRGTGVFLDPTLIVTSAHVVGHVSSSEKPETAEKPGRFDNSPISHTSCIGATTAFTNYGQTLTTRPLAVNFANDVAVLELANPAEALPHRPLASSPPEKENIVVAIAHVEDIEFTIILGNVRAVKFKTIRAKAPWPMDDELGWIEHDWFFFGGNGAPPESILCTSIEKVSGSITRIPGGPWFNLNGEVVGISSWELNDERARFSVGYAAPPSSIRAVLDYAKTKGRDDPIVMDPWIDAHVVVGD